MLRLICQTRGRPSPSVVWSQNGIVLARDVDYIIINTNVGKVDGVYMCTATNVFGSVTKSSQILRISKCGR